MTRIVSSILLVLFVPAQLLSQTKTVSGEDIPLTELHNASPATEPESASAAESVSNLGTQEPKSSPIESRYVLADPDQFGMNITVARRDLGDHYHVEVYFTVPTDESIANFNLITIYGLQLEGGRRSDLPSDTFPSVRGNWKSGDQVTLQVDLPKKFADPEKGWNLTFCVGTAEKCLPSPNLLVPKGTAGSIVGTLNKIKAALESYSNLRASTLSEFSLQFSGTYRIERINKCGITLVHRSTTVDRNYDGAESTTTSLVHLGDLSSDAKVTERGYGNGWKPPSRWVLSDDVIAGRAPISTETVIKRFPGQGHVDRSPSYRIEIEFTDRDVAEVVRKMLIHEIMACGEAK